VALSIELIAKNWNALSMMILVCNTCVSVGYSIDLILTPPSSGSVFVFVLFSSLLFRLPLFLMCLAHFFPSLLSLFFFLSDVYGQKVFWLIFNFSTLFIYLLSASFISYYGDQLLDVARTAHARASRYLTASSPSSSFTLPAMLTSSTSPFPLPSTQPLTNSPPSPPNPSSRIELLLQYDYLFNHILNRPIVFKIASVPITQSLLARTLLTTATILFSLSRFIGQ
jgi:hypothetical protein